MQEPLAMPAPDAVQGAAHTAKAVLSSPDRVPGVKRPREGRLATAVLAHLPLAVAVVDADARLLFWNEQAAIMFGVPPAAAAANPPLAHILTGILSLTPQQRERIVAFSTGHISAGDRTEPEDYLRISLGRDHRITVQMRGIGFQRWMLVIDDGKIALASGRDRSAYGGGDAWLDPLTGLSNRRHFNQVLRDLVANALPGARHALLMIDLDRFKHVNDTLGHPVGDALLCLVAQRMRREARDDDLLVRLGGDEFAILLPNTEKAEPLAKRIVESLSHSFMVESHVAWIGASIGIACFPQHGTSADDLIRHADLALHDAKSAGGQTWRTFDPALAAQSRIRQEWEIDLRKALMLNEFALEYRMQSSLLTRALTGFEVSPNWSHSTRGIVPPSVFIPLAEATGCSVPLGEWVLNTACAEAVRWPFPLVVTVNLSAKQLKDSDRLNGAVQEALRASGLPASRLQLSVTEDSFLLEEAHVLQTLHRLRGLGVQIKLAGFAIGLSSRSRLRSFPFDTIRVDRNGSPALVPDADAAAVVQALVNPKLHVDIVARIHDVNPPQQARYEVTVDRLEDELPALAINAAEINTFFRGYIPVSEKVLASG